MMLPRRFQVFDVYGGQRAEGVVFTSGRVAVSWLPNYGDTLLTYADVDHAIACLTPGWQIVWVDSVPTPPLGWTAQRITGPRTPPQEPA